MPPERDAPAQPAIQPSWHTKYWDSVEQFYWDPGHLGLASIPKAQWGEDPSLIQIERSRIKNGGTLYTRIGTSAENGVRMRGLEETLNHVYDLTFAIASDWAISELLHSRVSINDPGPFLRLGREIAARYGWGFSNVTQQDGFYVSPSSILGVELKLGAATSRKQILQYIALMVWEERLTGLRPVLGMLYVTPSFEPTKVWRECGAGGEGRLPADFLDSCANLKLSPKLQQIVSEERDHFIDAISRLAIGHISWTALVDSCEAMISTLDPQQPGDETLIRLLSGFAHGVREHRGTGADPTSLVRANTHSAA